MVDQLTPGQTIKCTITAVPRAEARKKTVARLMRRDPAISTGLRKAQAHRRRTMIVYSRGGRDWYSRKKASRLAHVQAGNTWTMAYTPDLANDLKSVSQYVSIEGA